MLPLTETQINKIKRAENGMQLKLSLSQLNHMEKNGGCLPLIPIIAAVLGAAGAAAGGISNAVNASKQTN